MSYNLGLGEWKANTYNQTMNLYGLEGGQYSAITAMTTPGVGVSVTSPYTSGGLTSSWLFGSDYNSYANNYLDYQMDIFYNMQDMGVIYPSFTGQRTRLAGDRINEISMWGNIGTKDILVGEFNRMTACFTEGILKNILSC